ncbi:MAG: antibiotic biosynthesis monooxygenase family protein [Endozoicomonas sp.]
MTETIASTPQPPYYAVIFTSIRTDVDAGYAEAARRMLELAEQQPGYLGTESAREELGITVSYWRDLDSIQHWRNNTEHAEARNKGRSVWYDSFRVRICKVEKEHGIPTQ